MSFVAATSWAELFAQDTGREYGVILHEDDPWATKLSVQIGVRDPLKTSGEEGFAIWIDVTDRVRGLEWDRGATEPLTQSDVGTASITFENLDGLVSPWATSGEFSNPAPSLPQWDVTAWDEVGVGGMSSMIRPNTPFRFGTTQINPDTHEETYTALFTGLLETVTEDTEQNVDAWIYVSLVDVAVSLAAIGTANGTDGGGDFVNGNTGESVARGLITDAGIAYDYVSTVPPGDRFFDTPPFVCPPNDINRLVALQQIATSGLVNVGASPAGVITMSPSVGGPILGVFSNDPNPGELPVVKMTPYSSTDRLLNQVTGSKIDVAESGGSDGSTASGSAGPTGAPGAIIAWARRLVPRGWLLCDGSAVSRTTYSDLFLALVETLGTATMTIASPCVVTLPGHQLVEGDPIRFTTTGTLPTGIVAGTQYYVIAAGLTADTFRFSATVGGAAVNTSGTQSGVHTLYCAPWGLGDGETTFNLPNLAGRELLGTSPAYPLGSTGGSTTHTHGVGSLTTSSVPVTVTGTVSSHSHDSGSYVAEIAASASDNTVYMHRVAAATWTDTQVATPTVNTSAGVNRTNGVQVQGSSGNTAPTWTQTGGTAAAGTVGGTLTNATGPIDPYAAVRVIIKH
jgi:microcystin-dependent protein